VALLRRPSILRDNSLPQLLDWTKHTTDNIARVNAPQLNYCSVSMTAAQSVATATLTPVAFDTFLTLSGSLFTLSVSGITCALAGQLFVDYSLLLAGSAAGTYRGTYLQLLRTGTNDTRGRVLLPPFAVGFAGSGAGTFTVQAGDVVQLIVQQDSGGALAINTTWTRADLHYLSFD
jgi:hypothetical protein